MSTVGLNAQLCCDHYGLSHRCKKVFFYFLLEFKPHVLKMFLMFLLFNVVFLLLLKHKRTKLQI